MERQLILWPETEDPCQELNIWDDLDPTTQQMVITLLSRLIAKVVCQNPKTQEEVNHE